MLILEDEDIETNSSEHSKFLQRFLGRYTNVHSSNKDILYKICFLERDR